MKVATAALVALVAAIVWGAFTFGAVYRWAYWPLTIAALTIALAGLSIRAPRGWRPLGLFPLAAALAVLVLAVSIQLIPLPADMLRTISPEAPAVIAQLDLISSMQPAADHPLSIAPERTLRGLVVIASLALLMLGATRLLSMTGVAGLARAIAMVGVALALTGIIQQSMFTGWIYGFWPQSGGSPYGPFINKNHFAGWMLMGLPVTLGLLCSGLTRGLRGVGNGWRDRALWLASPHASEVLLVGGAAAIMTLSLILTMSRSGMLSASCAVVAIAVLVVRRAATRARRLIAIAMLVAIPVLVIGRAGPGTIAARFTSADVNDLNGRLGPWQDAIRIARRYPLVGTGFNTYGQATLFYQSFNPSVHYAQAHNDYLQLAAEGGWLLSVPAAVCVGLLVIAIRRRFKEETSESTYWIRAGATTGIAAMAVQELVEFSLQMPGNAFLFVVLCAIALHRQPERRHVGAGFPGARVPA